MKERPDSVLSGLSLSSVAFSRTAAPLKRLSFSAPRFSSDRDSRRAASPPVERLWGMRGGVRGGEEGPFFRKALPPLPGSPSSPHLSYFPNPRSRRALSTTDTDEKAIAAPAIMGEREGPPKSLSTPAAMGMHRIL